MNGDGCLMGEGLQQDRLHENWIRFFVRHIVQDFLNSRLVPLVKTRLLCLVKLLNTRSIMIT